MLIGIFVQVPLGRIVVAHRDIVPAADMEKCLADKVTILWGAVPG